MFDRSKSFNLSGVSHERDPELLSDRELFETAQRIGGLALKSRRAFIGLLPLVERRRAYEGRTFYSIYDFAAKVGGVGRDIVNEVLRVDQYLVDAPKLRRKLYRGEIGWSKMVRVVHWITRSNEDEWIQKLENLSKPALETYLRDYQNQLVKDVPTLWANALPGSDKTLENGVKFEAESLPGQESEVKNDRQFMQESPTTPIFSNVQPSSPYKLAELSQQRETFTFSMRSDIAARLRLFRQRLEKDRRELVTWEEVMTEFLKMIEGEIRDEEKKKSEEAVKKEQEKSQQKIAQAQQKAEEKPATRYIPAHIRNALDAQYEGLCAFINCTQPATSYHHTRRFALTSENASQAEVHDPRYLKPLCTDHERIIHNTLIENEACDPSTWKLLTKPDSASPRGQLDQKVQEFRRPP